MRISIMYSRETCSVVSSRLLAGLLVFLLSFLVGVSAVRSVIWLGSYPFTKPSSFKPCVNEGGVDVNIVRRKSGDNLDSVTVLRLSNHSEKTVYFFVDKYGNLVDFSKSEVPAKKPKILPPFGSEVFSTEKYDRDTFNLTFSYYFDDELNSRTATMQFDSRSYLPIS